MPFARCFYHLIWATFERQPLISDSVERIIYGVVKNKAIEARVDLLAINGTADHIHIAIKAPPTIAISSWVGKVKGASSFAINTSAAHLEPPFKWQESFGVLTFGEKNLSAVIDYIANQKQHHTRNDLAPYLERDRE